MKEKYYAIRIGDPRRNTPYFMVGGGTIMTGVVPLLFSNRKSAKDHLLALPTDKGRKVVRVFVTTTP